MNNQLNVHSIESFGTHEGPGIRMVVFLQGCNIKCLYCQNADTIPIPGGSVYTVEELTKKAVNLKSYFAKKGGLTVSGGEPLLQSKALIEFFEALKGAGIHTNIDTNGTVVNSYSKQLISDTSDLVMFDIKHANALGYEKITGKRLFEKSEYMINLREKSGKPYWFRYVLVPGFTDFEDDLLSIGKRYGASKHLERFQILPYHKLGAYKWEALGEKYRLEGVAENTPAQIEKAKLILEGYFGEIIV